MRFDYICKHAIYDTAISFVAISMNRAIGEKTGPKRRIVAIFWSLKLIYLSEDGKDFYLKCCKNKPTEALSGWQ